MLFGKKSGIKNRNRERYERVRRLMWIKCEACGKLVYYKDYKDNKYICPSCGRAFIMTPKQRFDLLFDDNTWEKLTPPIVSDDPLKFTDRVAYTDRLDDARSETGCYDAVSTADGTIGGVPSTVCVLNGLFMMGSMGRAAGDAIVAAMEHAIAEHRPFIMVTSSGGARMQENILSLMQMARTTVAVNKLHANGIPYIVLLTDPTFGGVTASFAMLGDIHIAEKGARIGFAGRRVIEQNIREKLPSNFQTAEYLYEHGMVDMVVARGDLHTAIAKILAVLTKQERTPKQIVATTPSHDASKKFVAWAKPRPMTRFYWRVMKTVHISWITSMALLMTGHTLPATGCILKMRQWVPVLGFGVVFPPLLSARNRDAQLKHVKSIALAWQTRTAIARRYV